MPICRTDPALPLGVDLDVAARLQPRERAVGPCRGQRRQHVDAARLALHQHLGDTGGRAEVAVDLERRVVVPQVVERRTLELLAQQLVSAIAVEQASPEVDLPGLRPAGSAVTAALERGARRLGQFRRLGGRHGASREERVQVRDVAVLVGRVVQRLLHLPLLQLAPRADVEARVDARSFSSRSAR